MDKEEARREAERRQGTQPAWMMWASIKSKLRAASESAILRTRQMFGEPRIGSTVKEAAAKDESQ